jgi:hypothetical protein
LAELLLAGAGGVVLGAILVIVVDLVFALASLGGFGTASGVLAIVPATFVYFEEYRKQPLSWLAVLCALLALIIAAGVGYSVATVTGLPPLGSGIAAAMAAAIVYAVLWRTATRGKNL